MNKLNFMNFIHDSFYFGSDLCISRSGYTGEDGFEISMDEKIAEKFVQKIFENKELVPAGLVARDILRIEAGLCLYGKEMNSQIDPKTAKLNWLVKNENSKLKLKNI